VAVPPARAATSVRAPFVEFTRARALALTRCAVCAHACCRASKYTFGDRRYSCGDHFSCALRLAPPRCALRRIDSALQRLRFTPRPTCLSHLSHTLCLRPAAAQCREAERQHHHDRRRGRGRALGGLQLDSRRLGAPLAAAAAAAGRCEAAWSCEAAAEAAGRRSSAAAGTGRLRRAARVSLAALAALAGRRWRHQPRGRCCKNCGASVRFLSCCMHACARAMCVPDVPNAPPHDGMRGVAGP
jgi:hypothetical protein